MNFSKNRITFLFDYFFFFFFDPIPLEFQWRLVGRAGKNPTKLVLLDGCRGIDWWPTPCDVKDSTSEMHRRELWRIRLLQTVFMASIPLPPVKRIDSIRLFQFTTRLIGYLRRVEVRGKRIPTCWNSNKDLRILQRPIPRRWLPHRRDTCQRPGRPG